MDRFLSAEDVDLIARSRGYVKPGTKPFRTAARGRGFVRPGTPTFRRLARRQGFQPALGMADVIRAQRFSVDEVIDVGVNTGTPWLYDAFPDPRYVLVDPLPDGEALLASPPERFTFVNCGLGAEAGTLTLNRYHNRMLTSFLELHHYVADEEQVPQRRRLKETVEVPVRTLDEIIEEHCHSDSIGIKLDTEGFELEVIKGLDKHRHRVTFIAAETSIIRRHKDAYQFSDLVAELRDRGFYFLNVMNSLTPAPGFLDSIFVQRQDPRLERPVNRIQDLEAADQAARQSVLSGGSMSDRSR